MRDHSRDYYGNNYIDGRYPSVKAPAPEFRDDDYWDDDEESWSGRDPIQVRGGEESLPEYHREGRERGDDTPAEEFYDVDESDESSWEVNQYLRTLPPRVTTKRSVHAAEQAPAFEDGARAWRKDPGVRQQENQRYEDTDLEEGPVMPLTIVLLVTAALLTVIAGVGRFHGYRDLDYNWRSAPLLSLVFSGWHENISPLTAWTQDPVSTDPGDTDRNTTSPAEGSAEDGSGSAPAPDDSEQAPQVVDLNIPDGVNDAVVQAVDYGICDRRFLAAEGTTFEPLTEGIFAPNGTYLEPVVVDERYFADALFIGDSRTDGLHLYGNMKDDAYFWCKEALSVYDIFDAKAVFYEPGNDDGTEMSLAEAMSESTFRKIYISIGINELGTPDTVRFYNQYKELISYLRAQQPDALIYIQGIMHVSRSYSQSDSSFNNTNIVEKNTAIASLANGRDIFYLDMNDVVCDENGDLLDDLSNDGLHLKASAYALWKEDLLGHAFVRDDADWIEEAAASPAAGEDGSAGQGTGKAESDIAPETGYVVQ